MALYYEYHSTAPSFSPVVNETQSVDTSEQSEFDRHRETLLSDDAEEGWASELRRYLCTMQRKVKKDTDLIEWWQVRILNIFALFCVLISIV